jgi:asparagine synthase (glutamine-hydrolysing)
MKNKLPETILRRKKVGFDIPAHEWLRGPLRELLLDTMQEGLVENKSLFRPGAIQELVRLHLERRVNIGYHLWGLLLLFLWMKKWGIQTGPSPAPAPWIREKTGIST